MIVPMRRSVLRRLRQSVTCRCFGTQQTSPRDSVVSRIHISKRTHRVRTLRQTPTTTRPHEVNAAYGKRYHREVVSTLPVVFFNMTGCQINGKRSVSIDSVKCYFRTAPSANRGVTGRVRTDSRTDEQYDTADGITAGFALSQTSVLEPLNCSTGATSWSAKMENAKFVRFARGTGQMITIGNLIALWDIVTSANPQICIQAKHIVRAHKLEQLPIQVLWRAPGGNAQPRSPQSRLRPWCREISLNSRSLPNGPNRR